MSSAGLWKSLAYRTNTVNISMDFLHTGLSCLFQSGLLVNDLERIWCYGRLWTGQFPCCNRLNRIICLVRQMSFSAHCHFLTFLTLMQVGQCGRKFDYQQNDTKHVMKTFFMACVIKEPAIIFSIKIVQIAFFASLDSIYRKFSKPIFLPLQ